MRKTYSGIVALVGIIAGLLVPAIASAYTVSGAVVTLVASTDFFADDNTGLIQALLNNTNYTKIIIPPGTNNASWKVRPLFFAHGNTEIHLNANTILEAKPGDYLSGYDCVLTATSLSNVAVTGDAGAKILMHKDEYAALAASEWRHALKFMSCNGITVSGLTLESAGGDGIYLGDAGNSGGYCSNVNITNVITDNVARNGLAVISVDGLNVSGCTFKNTCGQGNLATLGPWAGVDLEPNLSTERLANIVFNNCNFSSNAGPGFLTHQGFLSGSTRQLDITVNNCTMDNNGGHGVCLSYIPNTLGSGSTITFTNIGVKNNQNTGVCAINTAGANCQIKFKDSYLKNNNLTTKIAPILISQSQSYTGGNVLFDDVCVENNNATACLYLNASSGTIDSISGTIFASIPQTIKLVGSTTNITVAMPTSIYASRWKLDETSGSTAYAFNGYNGTLYNMSSPSCWGAGKIGNSLLFDGINDYVMTADAGDLDIGTGDFTVTAWFYRQTSTVTNQRLVCKGADIDGHNGYAFSVSDTGITGYLGNGSTRRTVSGTHLGVNQWNHVAFVIDRASNMTLYINGVKASTTSISDWSTLDLSNSYNLYLGSNFGTNCFWTGRIDDARIYKRALSEHEVLELQNDLNYVAPPKGCWKLDETSGSTAYEVNGYNGTLYSMSSPSCWGAGKIGNSLLFDGINDYVMTANAGDLDIGTGDFTVMAWFYRQTSTVTNQRLVCKGADSDSHKGYTFAVSNTNITGYLGNGSTRRTVSGAHLGVNQWNHVAFVIERTGNMTLYINGVKTSTASISDWSALDLNNSYNLYFGSNFGANCFWTGRIDDVRIYKQALSATDIFQASSGD